MLFAYPLLDLTLDDCCIFQCYSKGLFEVQILWLSLWKAWVSSPGVGPCPVWMWGKLPRWFWCAARLQNVGLPGARLWPLFSPLQLPPLPRAGPIRQRTCESLCLGGNFLIPSRSCHQLLLPFTATLSEGIVYACDSTLLYLYIHLNKSEKSCNPSHSFKLISNSIHLSPPLHSSCLPVRLCFPSPPTHTPTHSSTVCRTTSEDWTPLRLLYSGL